MIEQLMTAIAALIGELPQLIKTLIPPNMGTKFLLTGGGMGAVVYMQVTGVLNEIAAGAVVLMLLMYYVADIMHNPRTPVKPAGKEGEK